MLVIPLSDYLWLGKQVLSTTLVDSVVRPEVLGIKGRVLRRPRGKAILVNDGGSCRRGGCSSWGVE